MERPAGCVDIKQLLKTRLENQSLPEEGRGFKKPLHV